jgi:hypothetical protein
MLWRDGIPFAPPPQSTTPTPPKRPRTRLQGASEKVTFFLSAVDLADLDMLASRTGVGRSELLRQAVADLLRIDSVRP